MQNLELSLEDRITMKHRYPQHNSSIASMDTNEVKMGTHHIERNSIHYHLSILVQYPFQYAQHNNAKFRIQFRRPN